MKKILILTLLVFGLSAFNQKQIVWVAIGDSITYLNDHPEETGNRITKGYQTLLTEKFSNIKAVNQGYNGWTSADIANEIEKLGLIKADIYTIFLGTNDWWQGIPLGQLTDYEKATGSKTIYGSFRIIINKLKNLNADAKIILITPLQRGDFVYLNDFKNNAWGSYKPKNDEDLAALAAAIAEIGIIENIAVVDLYSNSGIDQTNMVKFKRLKNPETGQYKNYKYPAYTQVPFNPETDEYPYPVEAIKMTYDGLHPSDKGYKKIAKLLIKEFKKIVFFES
jgi:lysophospholipase L1-like esterase